jgi:heme exporter protein A
MLEGVMSEQSLRGENLHLWRGERHVLRGVTLTVRSGEIWQVTGANGAGKTTLLRTLCGLMHLEEGRVLWGGRDVREDLPTFHAGLLYIGHEPPLKPDLSAAENLRYWLGLRRRLTQPQITATLESVGAGGLRDRLVRTLSAGQKRRVALAALVLLAVPLWLLDEPTTNLDAEGQQLVARLIEQHARGGGLIVTAVHHELAVPSDSLRRLELAA